jgi:hypothetical protein
LIRLVLLCVCGYFIWAGIDGLWINMSTGKNPTVVSLSDIVAHPGKSLPRYMEVGGAEANAYVCTYDTSAQTKAADGSQRCKGMKVPLLTPEQLVASAEGKPVTASVIVETDEAVTEKCNNMVGGDCLAGVVYRGVTLGSVLNDLDEGDKTQLTKFKISLDAHTTFLKMQGAPDTAGKNILEIVGGAVGGLILLASFGKKKR